MKYREVTGILRKYNFYKVQNEDKSLNLLTVTEQNLFAAIREIITEVTMKVASSKPDNK